MRGKARFERTIQCCTQPLTALRLSCWSNGCDENTLQSFTHAGERSLDRAVASGTEYRMLQLNVASATGL